MPRIKITGVLPKAVLGLQVDPTTTTTMNPNITYDQDGNPQINFQRTMGGPDEALNLTDQEKQDNQLLEQKEWDPMAGEPIMKDEETDAYNAMGRKQQKKFDKGLLGKQDTKESMNQYTDWYNDKYPTLGMKAYKGLNKFANSKTFKTIDKLGKGIETGALIAQPIIDYVNDRKAQKKWDKWFRESSLPDNMYAAKSASATGNRGDWDINNGIFRPNEIGFKSKGQYTNAFQYPGNTVAYGGTPINENNMQKIRIKITGGSEPKMFMGGGNPYAPHFDSKDFPGQQYKVEDLEAFKPQDPNKHLAQSLNALGSQLSAVDNPKRFSKFFMATGGQPMSYTGQMGYGINLGQKRIYTDMPAGKSDEVSHTLQPVDRSKANIEAEKGETAWGDLDGDGALEHMNIGGQRHVDGGTPLSVPEGTFIFSDTKDMTIKDEKVLKMFSMGANKKGYTPAEIAKKYEVNKYKAIIEDPAADEMRKATAQLMVKSYQKKLAQLALIQEQMKGFPQGIPDVAKKVMPELRDMESPKQQASQQMPQQQDNQQMQVPQEQPQEAQPVGQGMAYGGASRLGMYAVGGNLVDTTTTASPNGIYDQTVSPTESAKLDDPEYPTLLKLLDELATKTNGQYYLSAISGGKQKELARLITKFGLSHVDEIINGNTVKGHKLSQNSTPGYTWTDPVKKQKVGFFGGMTPEMYEDKVIESVYPADKVAKMTPVQKRRLYFKELGIDDSKFTDVQLADTKKIYTDKKWFREEFYPKFTNTFVSNDYRNQKGDDWQVGLEHYDSYKYKTPETKPVPKGPAPKYMCGPNGVTVINPADPKNALPSQDANLNAGAVYDTYEEAAAACAAKPGTIPPGKKGRKAPFKYMSPDLATLAATAAIPPKKYLPWSPQVPFEPGDVVFEDWRAKAAERQGLMNKMMNQMNTYAPGTSAASNLSFLAGQGSEGLIKDIADVDARNVNTANAFSQQDIGRRDKNMAANLGRAEELYRGNVIANQQYDNSKRAYLNNMAKAYGQAWKNRMYLGLLNNVNNKYQVDPTSGYSGWTGSGKGWGDFNNGIGGDASGGYTPSQYPQLYAMYKGYGYSDTAAEKAALDAIGGKGKESTSDISGTDRAMLQNYSPNMWGQ
jgi:hypothetical protein